MARSEGAQHRIVKNLHNHFSDSKCTHPETLFIGTDADLIPSNNRKRTRRVSERGGRKVRRRYSPKFALHAC